jgi:hypothetical protein
MLPVTEQLTACVMTLPTGTAVGPSEISDICQIIRQTISQGPEVHERFLRSKPEFPRVAKPPLE